MLPIQHEVTNQDDVLEVDTVDTQTNTTQEEPTGEGLIGAESGPGVEVDQGEDPIEVKLEEEPTITEITMENTRDHIRNLQLVRSQL